MAPVSPWPRAPRTMASPENSISAGCLQVAASQPGKRDCVPVPLRGAHFFSQGPAALELHLRVVFQTELGVERTVVAPFFLDLDVEEQVHRPVEQFSQFLPRLLADPFQG